MTFQTLLRSDRFEKPNERQSRRADHHSILKFSCMIRGGPALEILPKLALSMLVAGPPRCLRVKILKKSAPNRVLTLSRRIGKYFNTEMFSSEYVQPRTLGR